jgi:hypothetical protein
MEQHPSQAPLQPQMNSQLDVIDLISILSFALGYENLMENREQSKQNDVQAANDTQAKYLLEELTKKFEEQNQMLKEILEVIKSDSN